MLQRLSCTTGRKTRRRRNVCTDMNFCCRSSQHRGHRNVETQRAAAAATAGHATARCHNPWARSGLNDPAICATTDTTQTITGEHITLRQGINAGTGDSEHIGTAGSQQSDSTVDKELACLCSVNCTHHNKDANDDHLSFQLSVTQVQNRAHGLGPFVIWRTARIITQTITMITSPVSPLYTTGPKS